MGVWSFLPRAEYRPFIGIRIQPAQSCRASQKATPGGVDVLGALTPDGGMLSNVPRQ